ncbi:NAD(P)H-dependent oxidoreductase [Oceanobacillus caeni]|uniref:NADPH-dependent FMN reductase n=1 Tax=Oceanobacillus caeni TaxID=405946 RepID=A0ABR5MH89_9BACI|nr:NADPH-dependent FMN reductase [Oceanobacillus caeni]KKE79424.1 NADPH-dependent FMN reductase [Bacilli bacterium VT-13-104]PZD88281.1 NAD(P)H-dependent oxidoreductase [Bacilli bacterium]KPH73223.1 NADPH-dependent FMN reductase [Oceanobacillus caeni]MBU8791190.1 NAD(P)H-dependent oxidoreductase [Oceanobacillus caeni]MCR1834032.1 NAD(P)H-dependent oxidoreductase [Oceanobacillus caeni]
MKNFIGIVGTNSDSSTNRLLLQFIQKHFTDKADIEICEIKNIPAFNKPTDKKAPIEVQKLADKITQADGVIISTPEYNHSIPATLKSTLEWLSYTSQPLIDKAVMITGASYGRLGSSRSQAHLRQILDAPELKARIMPSSEFLIGFSLQAFDEDGNLTDQKKIEELEERFNDFIQFVEITNQLVNINHSQKEKSQNFSWEGN